jgi:Uncharacterised nucleotidyltransferase
LSDEDLLLVLSLHAAKHLWQFLCWTCDLAVFLRRRPRFDWEKALADAERFDLLRVLLIFLSLGDQLLQAPLPQVVRHRIAADDRVTSAAHAVISALRAGEHHSFPTFRQHRLLLGTRRHWRNKGRYILRLILSPGASEWSLLPLPDRLAFLYPALRVARLAVRPLEPLRARMRSGAAPGPRP